jgi:hypothetical protein
VLQVNYKTAVPKFISFDQDFKKHKRLVAHMQDLLQKYQIKKYTLYHTRSHIYYATKLGLSSLNLSLLDKHTSLMLVLIFQDEIDLIFPFNVRDFRLS